MDKTCKPRVEHNINSNDGEKLLEKRTSISAGEFPKIVIAKWPLGKVILFRDHIFLNALVEQYRLLYTDIDYIDFKPLQVVIYHHNLKVPKDVTIDGLFIPGILKKAIEQFYLPIKIK